MDTNETLLALSDREQEKEVACMLNLFAKILKSKTGEKEKLHHILHRLESEMRLKPMLDNLSLN